MLLKIIADLALQDIEENRCDIGQAVNNALQEVSIRRNMSNDEIINRVKEECENE